MTTIGDNSGSAAELRAFIERVEHVEAEIATLNGDKRDIYAEMKGRGYDSKAVRQIVRMRAKDPVQRQEEEAILDAYLNALGMSR